MRAIEARIVATAVVAVQRDFGNRSDRKLARLKYLIHNWGIERFKAPHLEPEEVHGFNDHLGWEQQGDGRWFYGLNVADCLGRAGNPSTG